jgi:hypothetical protein
LVSGPISIPVNCCRQAVPQGDRGVWCTSSMQLRIPNWNIILGGLQG